MSNRNVFALVCLLILMALPFFAFKAKLKTNTSLVPIPSPTQTTPTSSPLTYQSLPDPAKGWKTYTIPASGYRIPYTVVFQYPSYFTVSVLKNFPSNQIELRYLNSKLTIVPKMGPHGLESETLTDTYFVVNGKQVFGIDGKPITKTKAVSKIDGETQFIVTLPYPGNGIWYIEADYQFADGKINEKTNLIFDQVVASILLYDCRTEPKVCSDICIKGQPCPNCPTPEPICAPITK